MSTPKKEIIKAIYVQIANDELEFITIANKQELQTKIDKIKKSYPTQKIVIKTFMSCDEDEIPKFYRFACSYITGELVATAIPCGKFIDTFCIRHNSETKTVYITISGSCEDEASSKAIILCQYLYSKKYIHE